MDDTLKQIYYDPEHEAGYGSVTALVKASGASRRAVEEWLRKQDTYTLHRQARKKFRTRKYRTSGIDTQWQADLVDMQKYGQANDGYKWLLTVIDIFSKYAWAQPVKSKTAVHVQEAFRKIFETGRTPNRLLQTDEGNEFQSAEMTRFFNSINIHQFAVKSPYKAGIVERFNRTLRSRMQRYFTAKNTHRWIEVLPSLLTAYNKSHHRTINMAPKDVNEKNEMELWQEQELETQTPKRHQFKVGMFVRVSRTKGVFEKGYMANWTEEIFKITKILNTTPVQVQLEDLNGTEIEGSWYLPEIQRVTMPETFQIDKVIRTRKVRGRKEYLVKWRGYSDKFNQWIPENQMQQL